MNVDIGGQAQQQQDLGGPVHPQPQQLPQLPQPSLLDLSPSFLTPPPASTTVRITVQEVARLKLFFFKLGAERWNKAEQKAISKQIPTHSDYLHLKASQVQRVLTSYIGEMNIRKGVGELFERATLRMREEHKQAEHFLTFGVISCLAKMFDLSRCNVFNGLPTIFRAFAERVHNFASASFRADQAGPHPRTLLHEHDHSRMHSFVRFVQSVLLPEYATLWRKFRLVESGESESINALNKGRPDLSIADIETDMLLRRREWISQPNSVVKELFYALTYAGPCFMLAEEKEARAGASDVPASSGGSSNSGDEGGGAGGSSSNSSSRAPQAQSGWRSDLYRSEPSDPTAIPPPFAAMAMHGDTTALKSAAFAAFETTFYDYYAKHLILQSRALNCAEKLGGSTTTNNTSSSAAPAYEADDVDGGGVGEVGGSKSSEPTSQVLETLNMRSIYNSLCGGDGERDGGDEVDGSSGMSGDDLEHNTPADLIADVLSAVASTHASNVNSVAATASDPAGTATHSASTASNTTTTTSTNAASQADALARHISPQDCAVLYYITGATVRAALGVVRTVLSERCGTAEAVQYVLTLLLEQLTCTEAEAVKQALPVSIVLERRYSGAEMLFPCFDLYNFVLSIEREVMLPTLHSKLHVCVLGNQISTFVHTKLHALNGYDNLENYLMSVLSTDGNLHNVVSEEDCAALCAEMSAKFLTYYVKVTFAEYVQYINAHSRFDKKVNRLSFRIKTMLNGASVGNESL